MAAEPWPSKPGLPVAQQKAELVALLNQAARLRLNAVIFQVRPSADAFYASTLEPWSEFLMGRMGQAPQPFYDPLALAINAVAALVCFNLAGKVYRVGLLMYGRLPSLAQIAAVVRGS